MMLTTVDTLKAELGKFTLEESKQSFTPTELAEIEHTLKDAQCSEQIASFEAGPLYWPTRLTCTENPPHGDQGLPLKAPSLRKSYFIPLFNGFLRKDRALFISKSRTMMTFWAAMAFAAWATQWKREETLVQTANEDKCSHLIDYMRQLWDNQEPWLKARHPIAAQYVHNRNGKAAAKLRIYRQVRTRSALFTRQPTSWTKRIFA